MDGYTGDPNNLLEKLNYATQSSSIVDLYWGEVMELLRESRDKIEELTSQKEYVMTDIKCAICDETATWMRYTQFAGNHPFCDKHAELEKGFNNGDWEKLMPFGGYNPLDDGEYQDFSPWFKPKENKMNEVDLTKIQLVWTQDILVRIKTILDSKGWTEDQKLVSIAWLIKQGLKVERED